MRIEDLVYNLPPQLIAQEPARPRDACRLLVLHRATGKIEHRHFPNLLEYLSPLDVVILNNTRVIPARLFAEVAGKETERKVEVLLLRQESEAIWEALVKPGKKAKPGVHLNFGMGVRGEILGLTTTGSRRIQFALKQDASPMADLDTTLRKLGAAPLPPYITTPLKHAGDYQTVYARRPGSVAAPTAGLHFTPRMLATLRQHVAAVCSITLHIGPATFRPIRTDIVEDHPMLPEEFTLSARTAALINSKKKSGGRIVAVGTSSCRVLESCVDDTGLLHPDSGETSLFITQGFRFRAVEALLTNFHLPKSTNLLLVAAFAGREQTLAAYNEAISRHYRFYSFGDAMLII
jgi:S-adenosylmethionine:tRNA ribosyltransferase-isomerase